jgi:hypothetical protein
MSCLDVASHYLHTHHHQCFSWLIPLQLVQHIHHYILNKLKNDNTEFRKIKPSLPAFFYHIVHDVFYFFSFLSSRVIAANRAFSLFHFSLLASVISLFDSTPTPV